MEKKNNSKRDMILNAAYKLIIEKGYLDTKIIDIADLAGIGKGTVYEYFDSKDTIFHELFKTKVAAGYDSLSDLLEKEISSEKKLKEFLDIEVENTLKHQIQKNFLLDLMIRSDVFRSPALIESIHKLIKKKFAILRGIIEEGINNGEFRKTDPELAAVSVMGAINLYVTLDYCPFDPDEPLFSRSPKDWDRKDFLELILNGLKQ